MNRRLPAVAGQFYSASPQELRAEVEQCHDRSGKPVPALIAITPHAGLKYSGHVAGAVYSRLALPDTVILIGPNHTGSGPPISVYPTGTWLIPGAEVAVDRALAEQIVSRIRDAEADESAHRFEHCLEVQLPFLSYARQDLRIVPLIIGTTDPEACRTLARGLASVIQERSQAEPSDRTLVLATTDLTHYEPDTVVRGKDARVLQAIGRMDPECLYTEARAHQISMCGLGPTLAALHIARELGAGRASLVRYATSADVNGDYDRVVGYAGFIIPGASENRVIS